MTPEEFAELEPGEMIVRSYDNAKYAVVSKEPIPTTSMGNRAVLTIKRIDDEPERTAVDPGWWNRA